ncbi:MAG: glycosyltransferase [Caldilineae bacterium]|nr:MAG: glycosyltransferase [Caldilineae bacterium]
MPSVLLLRSSRHLGGIERQLLDHARRMQRAGWQVTLCCLMRGEEEHPLAAAARVCGLMAFTVADPGPLNLAVLRELRALIREVRPDLLHSLDYRTDVAAWLVARGMPRLVESHGHTRESRGMALWNLLDLRAMRRAEVVVAVSTAWETRLAAGGVPPHRIHVIGNSRAILPSEPAPSPRPLLSPGPHLLYAARLSPEKGIDLLLAAWPRLRSLYPEAHLWVLGEGVPRGKVARMLDQMRDDQIHRLGYQPDIRPWLHACDVVVAPSRQEAWGMTVFEALCAGKPVVTTRVGGLPELCRPAPHAHLVRPESAVALAEGVRCVLDPEFPRGPKLGRAFCNRPRFAPAHRHRQFLALYDLAVDRSAKSAP